MECPPHPADPPRCNGIAKSNAGGMIMPGKSQMDLMVGEIGIQWIQLVQPADKSHGGTGKIRV
jgi:hypothetical protein